MKKLRVIFKHVFIVLTLSIMAVLLYLYFIQPRFIDNKKKIAFDTTIMKEVNETFSIDDYTIILTHYSCDKEMGLAAAVFKVTKKGGKPEGKFDEDSNLAFGQFGDRFRFLEGYVKGEYKGNDLYIYLVFGRNSGASKSDFEEEMSINLYDWMKPDVPNDIRKVYVFPNTESPVEIKISADMSMKISSLGAYMTKECYRKVDNVTIFFKDGSKMEVEDSTKPYSLFEKYMNIDMAFAQFYKPIDLNNIDYILINGRKVEV